MKPDQAAIQLPFPEFDSRLELRKRIALLRLPTVRVKLQEVSATQYTPEQLIIKSPADAYQILRPVLSGLDREYLVVLGLDTRNRVIGIHEAVMGNGSSANIDVGQLFRAAILQAAMALIVAHNHPSGDPSPSPEDVRVTKALVEAGKLLDIELLDHMIIGDGRYVSLKERGLWPE